MRYFLPITLMLTGLTMSGCSGNETTHSPSLPGINLPENISADGPWQHDFQLTYCPAHRHQYLFDLARGTEVPAKFTVMHYAAADNNLDPVIMSDIGEMERGYQATSKVNVVVQLDRYAGYGEEAEKRKGAWRFEIGHGKDIEGDQRLEGLQSYPVAYSSEEPDSGDWKTLAEFGKWAVTCYPADQYIVIIGGHGGGWSTHDVDRSLLPASQARVSKMDEDTLLSLRRAAAHGESLRMIAPDSSHGTEMAIDELAQALQAISDLARREGDQNDTTRLLAYGSDACLMGTVEVAWELAKRTKEGEKNRATVNYVIGSEQTEPGPGWPYNTLIRKLSRTPNLYYDRPDQLMREVVDSYRRSYVPYNRPWGQEDVTFSAIYTRPLNRLRLRIAELADILSASLARPAVDGGEEPTSDPNAELRTRLLAAMNEAREKSYTFGSGYTDLGKFFAGLKENLQRDDIYVPELIPTITELLHVLRDEAVVARISTDTYPDVEGLSIYLPDSRWGAGVSGYNKSLFARNTGWDKVLDVFQAEGSDDPYYFDCEDGEYGYGSGNLTLVHQGHVFDDNDLECEMNGDWLFLYPEGVNPITVGEGDASQEIWPPDITLNIQVTDGQMFVKWASLTEWCPDNGCEEMKTTLESVSIQVTDATLNQAAQYAGKVSLPFEVNQHSIPVDITFSCDKFETYCND